ncbi:TonB-dependent receptor [Roseisolibacter sp. H3M3-2]|uniref:TonB-dependent receptor n=1 Tax=Roseisolibacter sp. H3M3-2 TaxID=3031323 RepID=UPI0023DC0491|nr:TonB-dependent receptor [Roseisolibacter sp. H3M3-2]MDF1502562.1 TonB-dependent receptor [Roseisolibacter sp. H3M3-2]
MPHVHPPSRPVPWLLVATLLGAPLAAPLVAQQPTGTVAGRVTGEDGGGIQGATISVTGTPLGAVTRGDGSYRLSLRPGRYELRARLIGYGLARDSVTVTAGGAATVNFRLERAASTLEAVAVVGTRAAEARTVIESPVPVDVLSAAEIRSTGRVETAQILQQLAPSVNFPRATISDGTDHVRPATLRGLGADQVLVLINGKRRHTSALVNVNSSIGRGQAAVDLNAIPASMIERIEVLRDGAAAQYGSDAIAGVVNIILKSNGAGEFAATAGRTQTTYAREFDADRKATDGGTVQLSVNGGVSRAQNSFLHGGVEYRDRGATNRTLGDPRPQSFSEASSNVTRTNTTGPINHRQGDAATTDLVGFFNAGHALESGLELFAFGGVGRRDGEAAGFFRRAQDDRTVRSIYPDGFLPLITSRIWDLSTTAGARTTLGGWRAELSTVFGGNSFRYDIENSNNASLGNASPREFYAGTLIDRQSTTNLDLTREFRPQGVRALRTAAGAEFRMDWYEIQEGDPDSWRDGDVRVIGANGQPTTTRAAPGAQVFPGFRPTDATSQSRNNVAVYADVETDVTDRFLVAVAGRFENYSDFGATTNGKLSSRFTLAPGYVLRGAASTGFRAPSLQQSFYSATATNFVNVNGNLTPFEIKTFPVSSQQARVLGASDLEPEKSVNLSAGVAMEPVRNLSLTVDAYQIDIDDRIVLSENFTGAAVAALLQPFGATGGRYFTNAIDTRTRGLDVVANYGLNLQANGFARFTAGFARNYTIVTRVDSTPPALSNQQEALFGRVERSRIEEGQPRTNVLLSATYDLRNFGLVARTQRFGEVTARTALTGAGVPSAPDQTFGAKWITDVSGSLRILSRVTFVVGADNVLDVYPDENSDRRNSTAASSGNANFGIFPYNQFSPFGFNGRYVYARVTVGL